MNAGHLLPWIMGGLAIATVAVAIAVSSTHSNAPAKLPALGETAIQPHPDNVLASIPTTTPPTPASASAPTSAPANEPSMTTVPAVQSQTMPPPVASSGQIWECTINGLRTFSSRPCGDKSSLREIGPVNRMDPTPALPYARSYEAESRNQPDYSYPGDQENSAPPAQEFAPSSSYPVFVGIPVHRRRPDAVHRPPHGHYRVPPPPKNNNSR